MEQRSETLDVARHRLDRIEIPGREILRIEVGSTLHGIGIGSDDLDLMGVTIEPWQAITGLGRFEHFTWRNAPEGERSQAGDIDLVVYGLKKYLRLATKGNPSTLLPLFAPAASVHHCDDIGRELRAMREHIVSLQCKPRFLGYMRGQRERALDGRGSGRGAREGRSEKWASHMVRLGYEARELLSTGFLTLPMHHGEAEMCRAIKRGEVPFDAALKLAENLEREVESIERSPLPERPGIKALEQWMHVVYSRAFSPGYAVAN